MSNHQGLTIARMNGHLVYRPGSDVFHVYTGVLTPSGRWVPAAGRTVCKVRSRRLSVLERTGAVLDLDGRRMCGRCTARLATLAARDVQPVARDACLRFYAGVQLRDLVTATHLTTTVDETHRVGFVMGLLFGQAPVVRPAETTWDPNRGWYVDRGKQPRQYLSLAAHDRHVYKQALFDLTAELLRRRRALVAAERTPEEIEAAARKREADAARDARILAERRRGAAMDRVLDRRTNSEYLMPHEKALLDTG